MLIMNWNILMKKNHWMKQEKNHIMIVNKIQKEDLNILIKEIINKNKKNLGQISIFNNIKKK